MQRHHVILAAAVLGGSAVALGALGAHGLEDSFTKPESKSWWETAVYYQMWHALALLALAALTPRPGRWVPGLMLLGVACFSGSLYALALGGTGALWGPVTPLGGSLLLAGWFGLAVRAARKDLSNAASVATLIAASFLALGVSGCQSTPDTLAVQAVAPLESARLGTLDSCFRSGDIYLASLPDESVLDLVARRGFRRVVDLRPVELVPDPTLANEARRHGLQFDSIPIDLTKELDDATVDRVLAALSTSIDQPVLLFCDTGARSALLFAIFRAAVQGVDIETALDDGRKAGMKPGASELQVRAQVDRLLRLTAASAEATSAPTTKSSSSSSRQAGGNA